MILIDRKLNKKPIKRWVRFCKILPRNCGIHWTPSETATYANYFIPVAKTKATSHGCVSFFIFCKFPTKLQKIWIATSLLVIKSIVTFDRSRTMVTGLWANHLPSQGPEAQGDYQVWAQGSDFEGWWHHDLLGRRQGRARVRGHRLVTQRITAPRRQWRCSGQLKALQVN